MKTGSKARKVIVRTGVLAGAVYGVLGSASQTNAMVVDAEMTTAFLTTSNTGTGNSGIVPVTYTPGTINIADASNTTIPVTATYDAADTNDTGTLWNVLKSVNTALATNTSGSATTVVWEQNIPLVDSLGNSTSLLLTVSEILPNNKNDFIHETSQTAAGSDGLSPNPLSLMGSEWTSNSTSEKLVFSLTGLTANAPFSLYVYGASNATTKGQGGTFTLAAGNGGASATTNVGTGFVSPSYANENFSVFDNNPTLSINPTPEQGLSWNVVTGTADGTGTVTFTETPSESTGTLVKEAINGFQLDVSTSVPEPTSVGLLGLAGLGLLRRRGKGRTS
jgi:hypothetical protein